MHGYAGHPAVGYEEGNEGYDLIPKQVVEAVEAVIATGREAIVRKEKGKWVVLENGRRIVYKEP